MHQLFPIHHGNLALPETHLVGVPGTELLELRDVFLQSDSPSQLYSKLTGRTLTLDPEEIARPPTADRSIS